MAESEQRQMAPAVQEEVADMARKDAQLHDQGQLPWSGAINKNY